ncbi:MAG: hypothetical protein K5979_13060 [Ruminococcus sp.]|nr:hypothetical protein [Ruminococcus sp.]
MSGKYQKKIEDIVKNADISDESELRKLYDGDSNPGIKPLYDALKEACNELDDPDDDDDFVLLKKRLSEFRRNSEYDEFWRLYNEYVEIIYPSGKSKPAEPAKKPVSFEPVTDDDDEITVEQAHNFFMDNKTIDLQPVDNVRVFFKNKAIFSGQDISVHTGIKFDFPDELEVSHKLVMITNYEMNEVIISGRLAAGRRDGKEMLYLVADKKNIKFDRFSNNGRFMVIFTDRSFKDINTPCKLYNQMITFKVKKLEAVENCLCIDFGTSNTAAGSYHILDPKDPERTPEIVEFYNSYDNTFSKICPTMMYIKDCSSEDDLRILFGYDAKKKLIEKNYVTDADVLFELKKWVSEADDEEYELHDENFNILSVSRKKLVKMYIDYIIECAEQYFGVKFKSLHFTAPVKMKGKFVSFMEECYSDKYSVCDFDHCVDEAVAVVFDHIDKEGLRLPDKEKQIDKKMVVLDCGGGTTDLAACDYHSEMKNSFRSITIHTRSENGDNSFGGNNITFKIMQLIKIKLCQALGDDELKAVINKGFERIFSGSESDVLKQIDDYFDDENVERYTILDRVYGEFNTLYDQCEKLIPTLFENSEISENEKPKVKRNFYFLWQFAEQVKLEFYREDKVMVNKKNLLDLDSVSRSSYLNIYDENGRLQEIRDPMDDIEISITEIRKLICGDIYLLINKLLPDRDHADDKDYYFLSGQSCKINLFNELLKEFIAGRKLRNKLYRNSSESKDIDLKLKCISGSISYIAANNSGNSGELRILTDRPAANYIPCFPGGEESGYGIYPLTSQQAELDISIHDMNDNSVRIITNRVAPIDDEPSDANKPFTVNELNNFIKNNSMFYLEDGIDKIAEIVKGLTDGSYALMLPSRDGYGFCLMFMRHNGGDFFISEPKYILFEEADVSFFNGR